MRGSSVEGDDGDDSSDAELLSKTVFTFQRKASRQPTVEPNPPTPASIARRTYRPRHAFDDLIAEGTTTGAALADEGFWETLRQPPGERDATSDPASTTHQGEDEGGAQGLPEELEYAISPDSGVDFFPALRPDPESKGLDVVGSQYGDCLRRIAKRLLVSDHVNVEEAERLLCEGILAEFGGGHRGEDHTLLHSAVHLIRECFRSAPNGPIAVAAAQLGEAIVQSFARGRATRAERLWSTWKIEKMLSEEEIRGDNEDRLCAEFLRLHAIVLSVCTRHCYISKEDMASTFLLVARLSLDRRLFEACWEPLGQIMEEIIGWLDVPRIHLIMEWIHGEGGGVLFEHSERPIRLAGLMGKSRLGQLAAKIVLDCAIFPPITTEVGGRRAMSEGDDYEFIAALNALLLEQYPAARLDGREVVSLHAILRMASCRLYYTFLDSEYGREIEALLASCSALRSAIPTLHYQAFIAAKDLLAKMEAYLRSFLVRSRHNRGYLGKQATLAVADVTKPLY